MLITSISISLARHAKAIVYAQKELPTEYPTVDPGLFGGVVGDIYNVLYPIAIIYGIFQIVISGYKIMASEGEPKKLDEAKQHLTDSIIGVIFVILAVVILRIIIKAFFDMDAA